MSEIRLRAIAQIGKISRELEKALPNKGHGILTGEKTKEQHPKAAGISVPTANRYEELAAPKSNGPRGRERHGELFCHDRCGEEGPTVWWHRSSDQKTDRRRLFILHQTAFKRPLLPNWLHWYSETVKKLSGQPLDAQEWANPKRIGSPTSRQARTLTRSGPIRSLDR